MNEAYEMLSDVRKKEEGLPTAQYDPNRTHSIFEEFFGMSGNRVPTHADFSTPDIKRRWSRMLDRLMESDFDYSQAQSGQTFKENSVWTKQEGV